MGASVTLVNAAVAVEPGGQVAVDVRVRNTGSVVDEFTLEVLGDSSGPADGGIDGSLDRRLLGRAFDRLDADDRTLLTLRFLWDLPVAETAAALDIVPGTIKSRTHAALRRLRAAFEAEARR